MLELWIGIAFAVIVLIAVLYVISIWVYKRAPANMGFIRTGWGGTKVCLGRGAMVLPVFHEVTWVSLETMKLIVNRSREQAVLTADKIRIDVVAELYTHVGHSEDALLTASRSLGEKTFDADAVRSLLEAKVVGAIRSYAATKTLTELHEDRIGFGRAIEDAVVESFKANGLALEEVTVVSLEQSAKEFFNANNIFDAEGLKVVTEITSDAKRKVHDTEKKTTVAIRQKDLDTQLELLEIERREAFAEAAQDKDVANEQAQQLGEKQIFMLDRRRAVEEQELANEVELERQRTARELAITEEAKKREQAEIQRRLAIEAEEREKQIALIQKAREEELAQIERNTALEHAEIARNLSREQAEKSRDIELASKERERREAEIALETEVQAAEEIARDARNMVAEEISIKIRQRALQTRKTELEIEQDQAISEVLQEKAVAEEKARALTEKQRILLERRKEVEQDEIATERAIEEARIVKEAEIISVSAAREAAEIRKQLAREAEERDRDIALVGKAQELEKAEIQRAQARESEERDREIALVAKDEVLRKAEIAQRAAVEVEAKQSEIQVIAAEQAREQADIQRFQARELTERQREIALVQKTQELEQAETERLKITAQRAMADHEVDRVRVVTGAEREGEATVARAKAASEAQRVAAEGIAAETAAPGRAHAEIEALRADNARKMLEAEAGGIEAKAEALAKYNDAAMFLELAKLHIEAERDVHIDQAKAMGTALSGAQIRMFGGDDGTVNTIRGMFTSGFSMGELLEGVAENLPAGVRERFAANGIRGIWGTPGRSGQFVEMAGQLAQLVRDNLGAPDQRQIPFREALVVLENAAEGNEAQTQAIGLLKSANEGGAFDEVPFETVWSLLQATAKASG